MNTHANYMADRLWGLIRHRANCFRARQALVLSAALIGVVGALAMLDFLWILDSMTRWSGLALGAVGFLLFGLWVRRRWGRRCTPKQAALELESRRAELGVLLSTSTDYFTAPPLASTAVEPTSVQRLHREAAKRLLQVEAGFYLRRCWLSLCSALLLLVTAGLFLGIAPNFRVALERALFPAARVAYTRFFISPGNAIAAEDSSIAVKGTVQGRFLERARIEWRKPTQEWNVAAVALDSQGRFSFDLRAAVPEIQYRLSAGPSYSKTYVIDVYSAAQVEWREWTVRLPAYTARRPATSIGENVTALRDSEVRLAVRFSKAVRNARIRFEDQSTFPFEQGSTPAEWSLHLRAEKDHQYWIDFVDTQGRSGSTAEPGDLRVTEDQAPIVAIITPGMDIRTEPNDKPKLEVAAEDDYGVRELKLVFQKLTDPEQTQVLKLGKPSEPGLAAVTNLDLAPLKLKEYELVAYYAEASDFNNLDGPGIGKSPVYFMEYTTNELILSRRNGACNKLNLLDLEKDVIAATTTAKEKEKSKLAEVAAAQERVIELAGIYEKGYQLAIAPEQARREFAAAKNNMQQAVSILREGKQAPAVHKEQEVLAGLYRVVALLPELKAGMCRGNGQCQKIVLEAIERLKEEENLQQAQTLKSLLQVAERMKQMQKLMNAQYGRAGQEQAEQEQADQQQSSPQSRNPAASPRQGNLAQETTQLKGSNPKDSADEQPSSAELRRLAGDQRQIADTLGDILKRLQELAGRGARLGTRTVEPLQKAKAALTRATDELNGLASRYDRTRYRAVGVYGTSGYSQLSEFTKQLADLMLKGDASTETAVEAVPPLYQASVSEYLRRLSFEGTSHEPSN